MTGSDAERTIQDFGSQWSRYVDNDGYYGSLALLGDVLGPLADTDHFHNKTVLDVGSGTGRIVNMLIAGGASHVIAVEPSNAFEVLRSNVARHGRKVSCLNVRCQDLPVNVVADEAVSIGVLHHIPDAGAVVHKVFEALRTNGTFIAWVYGREGNRLYLTIVEPTRAITSRLPHFLLSGICHVFNPLLFIYAKTSFWIKLPMCQYMKKVIAPLDWRKRHLVIYDQLNPSYSKYYLEHEARALLENAGFKEVQVYHRHNYSWTIIGRKC